MLTAIQFHIGFELNTNLLGEVQFCACCSICMCICPQIQLPDRIYIRFQTVKPNVIQ